MGFIIILHHRLPFGECVCHFFQPPKKGNELSKNQNFGKVATLLSNCRVRFSGIFVSPHLFCSEMSSFRKNCELPKTHLRPT